MGEVLSRIQKKRRAISGEERAGGETGSSSQERTVRDSEGNRKKVRRDREKVPK